MKHICSFWVLFSFLLVIFTGCGLQKFERPEKDEDSFSVTDEDAVSDDPDSVQDTNEDKDGDEIPDSDESGCGSVYFNGFDSYISVEHDDALDLGNTWTIEVWVMYDDTQNQSPIIRKGEGADLPSYWIYGKRSETSGSYSNIPSGGYQYGSMDAQSVWLYSNSDKTVGKWHHIALVKSEEYLELFIDGISNSKEAAQNKVFGNESALSFGARINDYPVFFSGLIDEIRFSFIPRYSENFTPEKRLSTDSSTTAVWHFEETSGTETASEGNKILKGILNGSAKFVNECAENEKECTNECFFEGATRCSDGILKTCGKNYNGCFVFMEQEECLSGLCENPSVCALDNCLFAGMTECVSGSSRICRELQNGLLDWSEPVTCSDGVCADEASCLSCSNECAVEGQSICSDGKVSACVSKGCLKWDTEKSCSSGKCADSTGCESDGWIDVSAGYYKCGINTDGELYCWRDSPYPEKMSTRTDWSKIAVSSYDPSLSYFCAIASGELYCMGYNANGELGDGTTVSKIEMVQIGSRNDWSDISTSNNNDVFATCGIAGGELFCWGNGVLSPQKMGTKTDWEKITGNCGIASGKIFCWDSLSSQPEQIGNREDWDQTTSYSYLEEYKYYCAISSGELFCWGNNDYGQLGDGTFESKSEPVKIGTRNDWEEIIGGYPLTCGIASGELFCWGQNIGLTGDSSVESVNVPTKIGTSNNWSALTYFGLCGVESGNFYCFKSITKDPLTKVGTINEWTQISTATMKICGISDDSLYCSDYLVNSATYTDFLKITNYSDWDSVSTGNYHSCAIRNEDLYCWGKNNSGQVGDSSSEDRENPVQIGLDRQWESVSCGGSHTCGTSGGNLYCWGSNSSGQVGDGTTYYKNMPQRIGSKIEWNKVSAGEAHTCGIESGELYCWGDNQYGQLGNGNFDPLDKPAKIGTGSNWEQIVSGDYSTCGIADGKLFCWGQVTESLTGKLRNIPTRIWSYNDFRQISIPGNLLCGLRNDNNLYCLNSTSIASGYNPMNFYPEKVAEIKWNHISKSGSMCGISDKNELYCPFMRQSSLLLQMLINP